MLGTLTHREMYDENGNDDRDSIFVLRPVAQGQPVSLHSRHVICVLCDETGSSLRPSLYSSSS